MKCYVVTWESGEYSDWYTETDGVFFTEEDAINYLDHKVVEMYQDIGSTDLTKFYHFDTISVFVHLKRVGNQQTYYGTAIDGDTWQVAYDKGSVYDDNRIWYIVEEELHGHPHNILYRCNQNASCNDSDMCAKNQFADNLQYAPICDATTDVKYAARFEHIVDDLYAEKGMIYLDHDNL